MLFNSRGFKEAAASKGAELEKAIMRASEGGKIPVIMDTSPCLSQFKSQLTEPGLKFALYEPVEFIRRFLKDKLEFKKVKKRVLYQFVRGSPFLIVRTMRWQHGS